MRGPASRGDWLDQDRWWWRGEATLGRALQLAFRLELTGLDLIPSIGGALLCYNHVSVLDPLMVGVAVAKRGRTVRFMALADDFRRPVVGWVLRRLRQVPVRRGAGDWRAIQEAAEVIKGGGLAGMAPEGSVGDGPKLLPGQKGAARVALMAGAPVIPVGVWGTQGRWPKSGLQLGRPLRTVVAIVFGPPIHPIGDPRSHPEVRAMTDRIMEGLAESAAQARRSLSNSGKLRDGAEPARPPDDG